MKNYISTYITVRNEDEEKKAIAYYRWHWKIKTKRGKMNYPFNVCPMTDKSRFSNFHDIKVYEKDITAEILGKTEIKKIEIEIHPDHPTLWRNFTITATDEVVCFINERQTKHQGKFANSKCFWEFLNEAIKTKFDDILVYKPQK